MNLNDPVVSKVVGAVYIEERQRFCKVGSEFDEAKDFPSFCISKSFSGAFVKFLKTKIHRNMLTTTKTFLPCRRNHRSARQWIYTQLCSTYSRNRQSLLLSKICWSIRYYLRLRCWQFQAPNHEFFRRPRSANKYIQSMESVSRWRAHWKQFQIVSMTRDLEDWCLTQYFGQSAKYSSSTAHE